MRRITIITKKLKNYIFRDELEIYLFIINVDIGKIFVEIKREKDIKQEIFYD